MDPITEADVEEKLAKAGQAMRPAPARLATALRERSVSATPSPLFIISSFMNTYTKLGVALVAVLVIAGGAFLVMSPSQSPTVAEMQKTVAALVADTTASVDTGSIVAVAVVAADGSIDALVAAIAGDVASQTAAIAAVDTATNASVSTLAGVTNTTTLYDPNTF